MFEEHKDLTAAEQEFLPLFEQADATAKRDLLKTFVKNFKKGYNDTLDILRDANINTRAAYLSADDVKKYGSLNPVYDQSSDYSMNKGILPRLKFALEYVQNFRGWNREDVQYLGGAVGVFMAVMEYGLPSTTCRAIKPEHRTEILNYSQQFSNHLQIIEKSTKQKFLKKRIAKIAKHHAGELTDEQKKLIIDIASLF